MSQESMRRIPFSSEAESVLNQLSGWSMFIAIVHLIGGVLLLLFGCCASCGVLSTVPALSGSVTGSIIAVFSAVTVFLVSLFGGGFFAQGIILIKARSPLTSDVNTDVDDQKYLAQSIEWFKVFFMVEVVVVILQILMNLTDLGSKIVLWAGTRTDTNRAYQPSLSTLSRSAISSTWGPPWCWVEG